MIYMTRSANCKKCGDTKRVFDHAYCARACDCVAIYDPSAPIGDDVKQYRSKKVRREQTLCDDGAQ